MRTCFLWRISILSLTFPSMAGKILFIWQKMIFYDAEWYQIIMISIHSRNNCQFLPIILSSWPSSLFIYQFPALRRVVEKPVLHPTSTVLLQWSTGFTDMKILSCQGRPVRLILWVPNCQRWPPLIAWELCHSCAQHFFCACATCVTFVLLALNWSLIIVEIDVWFQQNWLRSYLYLIICM